MVTLHLWLHSLNSEYNTEYLLNVFNLPSLEEWMHKLHHKQNDCVTMISLLDHLNWFLKVLNLQRGFSEELCILLQAMPLLECLSLSSEWKLKHATILDNMFTWMSHRMPGGSVSSVEGITSESFLPYLLFLDCGTISKTISPFTWDLIPQLYHQGHRQSLHWSLGLMNQIYWTKLPSNFYSLSRKEWTCVFMIQRQVGNFSRKENH